MRIMLGREQKPDGRIMKIVASPAYNYRFYYDTGEFYRWGKTKEDDPDYSPYGNEIADIEISEVCHGITGKGNCRFCYKSLDGNGKNMSLDTFRHILSILPKTLTQIAFGIGDLPTPDGNGGWTGGNPEMWDMFQLCRDNHIVPNVTINGDRLTDESVKKLVELCGAVAVSCYDRDLCYNAVKRLTDAGLKQCNIHQLLSEETYEDCFDRIRDQATDPRLADMGSIVFLWLKPKGDRNTFHPLSSFEQYKALTDYAMETGARFGFDSCGASTFARAIKDCPDVARLMPMVESCESTLFSYYINVEGKGFPCSFAEGNPAFPGIDLLSVNDFVEDVWNHPETSAFRKQILASKDCNGCRNCFIYNVGLAEAV
jgi:hypothetical protein